MLIVHLFSVNQCSDHQECFLWECSGAYKVHQETRIPGAMAVQNSHVADGHNLLKHLELISFSWSKRLLLLHFSISIEKSKVTAGIILLNVTRELYYIMLQ